MIAASNRTAERLNRTADKFHIQHRYQDWKAPLANPDVDAVINCLPEGLHAPVTEEAARRGKHVLVEKPMARNLAECDAMISASEKASIQLMVAHVLRFYPSHVRARQWIGEGRIGRGKKVDRRRHMNRALQAGANRAWSTDPKLSGDWLLYGFGVHEYDAILWLLDTAAVSVQANGTKDATWPGFSGITSDVVLANGVKAEVSLELNAAHPVSETIIQGTQNSLRLDTHSLSLEEEKIEFPDSSARAFRDQMATFVGCVLGKELPFPSGKNVRPTMELLDAIERSIRGNTSVSLS